MRRGRAEASGKERQRGPRAIDPWSLAALLMSARHARERQLSAEAAEVVARIAELIGEEGDEEAPESTEEMMESDDWPLPADGEARTGHDPEVRLHAAARGRIILS